MNKKELQSCVQSYIDRIDDITSVRPGFLTYKITRIKSDYAVFEVYRHRNYPPVCEIAFVYEDGSWLIDGDRGEVTYYLSGVEDTLGIDD